jgi:hypothetical protein
VKFGLLSVTLSNGWGTKNCADNYCTLSMAMPMDYGLKVVIGNNPIKAQVARSNRAGQAKNLKQFKRIQ